MDVNFLAALSTIAGTILGALGVGFAIGHAIAQKKAGETKEDK